LAGLEDENYKNGKIKFWENVYGFSMSSIKKWALKEPLVETINKE